MGRNTESTGFGCFMRSRIYSIGQRNQAADRHLILPMRDRAGGRSGYKTWLFATAIGITLMALSATVVLPKRVIWNASPSVPIGFYWVNYDAPKLDDIVLIELPEPYKTLANQRNYLPKNAPALKRIRGVSGASICRFERNILIDGVTVSTAQLSDIRSLKLPEWSGCTTLDEDEVFLLSDHPKSFDGRYFGPIKRDYILGIAVPIWTE